MFHCILHSSLPCCMKGYETLHTQSDAAGCAPRSFLDLAGHTYFFCLEIKFMFIHFHSECYMRCRRIIYMYKSTRKAGYTKEKQNKLNNEFS